MPGASSPSRPGASGASMPTPRSPSMPGAGTPSGPESGASEAEQSAAAEGSDGAEDAGQSPSDTVTLEDSEQVAASGEETAEAAAESGGGGAEASTEEAVLEAGIEAMETASAPPGGSAGEGEDGDAGGAPGSLEAAQAAAAGAAGSGGTEESERLNAELNAALGRFDGAMLEERERIQAGTEQTGSGDAQAESVAMLDPEAANGEAEGEYGSVREGRQPGEGTANDTASGSGMSTATGGTGRKGEFEHTAAVNTPPPDIPDGSDDDVVARQIREAAMKERDPELREKLWDEYRKYVNSAKGKS